MSAWRSRSRESDHAQRAAGGGRHDELRAGDGDRLVDGGERCVRRALGVATQGLPVAGAEQQRELVGADPGEECLVPVGDQAQPAGELPEHLVAGLVAERVVTVLKPTTSTTTTASSPSRPPISARAASGSACR